MVESSQPLAAESTVYKCFKTVVAMLRENNLQGNLENAWKVNEKSKNFKTNGFRSLDKLYLFHLGANGIISGKIILTQKYLSPSLFGLRTKERICFLFLLGATLKDMILRGGGRAGGKFFPVRVKASVQAHMA